MASHAVFVDVTAEGYTEEMVYEMRASGYVYRNGAHLVRLGGETVLLDPEISESDFVAWVRRHAQGLDRSNRVEITSSYRI